MKDDEDGRLVHSSSTARDMSAARKLEVEESPRLLQAIIRSSDDAIVTKTFEGVITSWNSGAERIFGYLAEEVIGKPITILFPRDRLGEETEFLRRLRAGEHIDHFETVRVRKDGREIHVSVTLSPIRSEDGSPLGVSKIARDISERVRAAARERAILGELEEAGRIKDEFLMTLSHELRTPLNAVFGWVRMLRDGLLPPERFEQALEVIERNCRIQTEMITDILDIARMRRGEERLELRSVDVAEVVGAAVETVSPTALAKQIEILTRLEDAPLIVQADAERLQQVLWNLVSNAVKFTPEQGKVEVTARRQGALLEIRVCDSGTGIAPEILPHVFEPFRQGDGSRTRRHGGLGLGLAIVRHLVELHGGSVRAESAGAGLGASFTVSLPFVAPSAVPGSASGRADSLGLPRLDGTTVLVVDDDADGRALVAHLLEAAGGRVLQAGSVAQAMETLAREVPHVVLTDLAMPGEDGFELVRAVRASGRASIPIVALSACAGEQDRRRVQAAGFDAYLAKPTEPGALVRRIAALGQRARGA